MKKIVFATNNQHKLLEVKALLPQYEIVGLKDIGCYEELPEEQDTLFGNALQKAQYVYDNFGVACFADDTGLLVTALNGAPGVYSARYAGVHRDSEANMLKLLNEMEFKIDRSAKFMTVICYYNGEEPQYFVGEVEGEILSSKSGDKGFGYDPIFQPKGYSISFAEMTDIEKNEISHRGNAVRKLIEGLK